MKVGEELAQIARAAVECGEEPRHAGRCQEWVRRRVQHWRGHRYDLFWRASAALTCDEFVAHPIAGVQVIQSSHPLDTKPGDLLYHRHGAGEFGHVAIRLDTQEAAENSSVHHGLFGAVGVRRLAALRFDHIVRFTQ